MTDQKSVYSSKDIRAVFGLDFGTTYSGFAYCHTLNNEICLNEYWANDVQLQFKINTVLQYDDEYNEVKLWGVSALVKRPEDRRNRNNNNNKPVELFKLHLGDLSDEFKPSLPVDYKKAITDYLREIGKVLLQHAGQLYDAKLIENKNSKNLQFTTEPEAAAIHCMKKNLKELDLTEPGTNFMIVDCGGGTVDLTTRKLINDKQLGESIESAGDFCGSTFIDAEFIKYLRKKLGDEPMDLLKKNNYGEMQYMIQDFCKYGKFPFTGDNADFSYTLDIRFTVPKLKKYIENPEIIKILEDEECEWTIEINFEDMKSIFEPVIKKILHMIEIQLDKLEIQLEKSQETCSAMFLVGGFSESKYLQKRIKQKFQGRVKNISVPIQPMAAIARGAAMYGLSIKDNLENLENDDNIISSRTLRYTYGIEVRNEWTEGDPVHRKLIDGRIAKFECLAGRGTEMNINQEVTCSFAPVYSVQKKAIVGIYYTQEYYAEYCDEPGMKLLGKLTINLPSSGLNRSVSFGLAFGKMEITATSRNEQTGQSCISSFKHEE